MAEHAEDEVIELLQIRAGGRCINEQQTQTVVEMQQLVQDIVT